MTKRTKLPVPSRVQRKANILYLLSATVLVVVAVGTVGWGRAQAAGAFSVWDSGVTSALSQETEESLQLIIGDSGFEPTQVTRRPGKFLLTADDRRGDKSQRLTLRLSRESGELLREIEVSAQATDWAEELDLPAGRYALGEATHTEWSCRIILE